MITDNQRITNSIRDPSPCKGCPDRKTACSDRCEKYKNWKAEISRVKGEKQKYLDRVNVRHKNYLGGGSYGQE